MEKGIDEVLDAGTRLLAEMKSGTRERTMLSSVIKALKRRVQETKQPQRVPGQTTPSKTSGNVRAPAPATPPPRDASTALPSDAGTTTPAAEKPAKGHDPLPAQVNTTLPSTVAATATANTPEKTRAMSASPLPSASAETSSSTSYNPIQQHLCDEDEMSKLAYACRMAIIGENGGTNRNSPRMLTASLELAAVVLTSGVIPQELIAPVPVFAIPESTMTGAQVFFSKLLGGKKHVAASGQAGTSREAGSEARSTVSSASPQPAEEDKPKVNMRDQLVDAVLTTVDAAQAKESNDRLCFVTIASLMACAVPRLSRCTCADVQANTLLSQQLSVHGGRLVRVFRLLLAWCSRPQGLSSIFVDEAQKAVHGITRALSKYVEFEANDQSGAGREKARSKQPNNLPQDPSQPKQRQEQQTQDLSTASSSAPTSVAATPLTSLSAAAARTGRDGVNGFADSLASHNRVDTAASLSANASFLATTATSPLMEVQRFMSLDETSTITVPPLAAPRVLRGVRDMRLLLALCGNVARLTPLPGITSTSGGGVAAAAVADTSSSDGALSGVNAVRSGGAHRDAAASAKTSGAVGLAGKVGAEDDADGAALTASFPAQYMNTNTLATSLSFILYVVVNGGPRFRKSTEIVPLLRQLVVPAAVRTSVSDDLDVFRLSVNLLLLCCLRFGPQMVNETSTVFRHVYFRVLESSFTALEHKMLVLDAFNSYIEEPQLLLGLFLNYDCNTHSQSIYEMMIHYLGALAMPPAQNIFNVNLAAELKRVLTVRLEYDVPESLRRKALVSLLQVSDSNIQWIERFECDQEEDSHGSAASSTTTITAHAHPGALEATLTDITDGHGARDGGEDGLRRSDASQQVVGPDGGAGGGPGANTETFLQVRRYKDAFRKFLYLFNEKATPDAAIGYLKSSVLMLDDTELAAPAAMVTPTPATPELQATSDEAENTAQVEAEVVAAAAARLEDENASRETTGDARSEARTDEMQSNAGENGAVPPTVAEEPTAATDPPVSTNAPAAAENGAATTTATAAAAPVVSDVDDAMRLPARRVAVFLKRNEDYIDKMILGDYFSKSFLKPPTRVVFEEWIAQHDFTDMTLDAALRLFLGGFKLLGEAQVVDRTMELFAAQFCRQNHGVFGSADTAFILSFSICMLNTDAHSPHIKNKMTKEGFLQNNKGIDEGNDVDPAILGGIYDRISADEIVLRPSPKCFTQLSSKKPSDSGKRGDIKVTTSLLDSIPLLRHLAPIATAITDKVLLPIDAAGYGLFNSSQRKREEMYQRELRTTLKAVMDALQEASTNDAVHHAMFVTATSIENALPMWEVTVDVVCHVVLLSLQQLLEDSEKYVRPQAFSSPNTSSEKAPGSEYDAVAAFMEDTKSASYFSAMLTGLHNTVRVCCSFGNVSHTEQLLEHAFEMTHLSSVVVVSALPSARVTVQSTLPFTRLNLLSTFLNLFVYCGVSFNARGWQAAYKAMSLVDALANGVEGMWRRQARRLHGSALASRETGLIAPARPTEPVTSPSPPPPGKATAPNNNNGSPISVAPKERQYADLWFGALNDVPSSIVDRASRENRKSILSGLRATSTSHVDLWLDHLFDATQYPSRVQLEMTNGLVKVCEMELQYGRTFSLTRLFDFVGICASFSSRLQWRELWTHASEVFTLAGCGSSTEIALSSLDGLRLIALTYLMREELLNYSFQKEVLKPFESILMSNQNVSCRQKVMMILSELIDFRAAHLASGWNVVFSCLSHAAAIPDVAPEAWAICEGIMAKHIAHLKDCFSDLIFCLTTFACSGVDESMPLRAISYLIVCGHWLQYGLEAPPSDVRAADTVARWAVRFHTVEQELAAARMLGKHLPRVTLAAEPLTYDAPLQKPTTFTTKTNYHLWMSLFEGMVPIVVVHSSVRVRAHALSSIWALLAQYAGLFDDEVQSSLFSGMVRPMLTTLFTHVPEGVDVTSPPMAGNSEFDRFDYRLLVYFALKGMLLACKHHTHLLTLACKALVELVETTKISLQMMRNDYVDEVLRVCFDLVWAAPSLVTIDALEQLAPLPAPSAGEAQNYAERLYQLIPTEARHNNPFLVGLVHELQQAGVVDVVHFKRTAGWTELHQTPAAQNLPVQVDLSATSVEAASAMVVQLRSTIYDCLTRGLMGQLHQLLSVYESDRAVCLAVTGALRHVLLGVSFYFVVTRDARAVGLLKSVMSTAHDHVAKETHEVELMKIDAAVGGASAADVTAVSPASPASPASSPPSPSGFVSSPSRVFFKASNGSAIETLLLIPYACVLLEFIASFDLGELDTNVVCGDLDVYMKRCLDEMRHARQLCVELQLSAENGIGGTSSACADAAATTTQTESPSSPPVSPPPPQSPTSREKRDGVVTRDVTAAASAAANPRDAFTVYEGLHFCDVFRCACYPIASRLLYLTPQTPVVVQHRIFAEWCYVLHTYALKCIAILGNRSVLLRACSTRALVDLLCSIPSALEEGATSVFLNSCWEEMDLHCSMPSSSCVELCTSVILSRL
ncbi:hypothetical protein ABB37_03414 [Leptomonas pyrrhocoris]|uniref:SEC7 domain-containing protein n=1 Tax=Leptomonas pyrrhocoris TaxID=157538 RepID=A0A0N1J510_LEPPY|nr:hypothetical protein ABB37_03414 [Leptomonas pyrrhocoris]KPA82318.1 hypothetical protein ABB37_03414 [Leptomonas pyrrhocoris]|eukprot:XP_015660757.1 hypothetical protein ABB37_03414 [Leptomonas pyrrhocoris]